MLYLLDANTLIDADRDYYPLDRVPEFWDWMLWQAAHEHVRIPSEIYAEMVDYQGTLVTWLKNHKETLLLDELVDLSLVHMILEEGYGNDLTEDEVAKIGRDPFLVAYALKNSSQRSVVTTEKSRPSAQRCNRKVPDICSFFNLECYHTFELIKRLDFRTNWRQR